MAKVYEFPVKKEIPEEMKQKLDKLAKEYVEVLGSAFKEMTEDVTNERELNDITELILFTYVEAVGKAIEELEEP